MKKEAVLFKAASFLVIALGWIGQSENRCN